MVSIRSFLLAALPLTSLIACGGGDDGGTVTPEGAHYHYVANKANVPTNNTQARDFGLDLNNDGTPDNQLGMVLGTLSTMGIDVQATIDKAVAEGSIILLMDLQTKDFTNTAAAGMKVLLGANPNPAACNTGEMFCNTATPPVCTGCGHHLSGSATFDIAAGSPDNAAVGGKIVNGTFTGGPGDIALQIALGGTQAIQLNLIGARVKASGLSATGATSVVFGGALTKMDLDTKVIPAIQAQLGPLIARDCNMLSAPPACGCMSGSTGKTVLDLFDGDLAGTQKDCAVSVEEIQGNSLIQSLLAPDVTIDGVDALSLGIKVEGTGAMFTVPGETP